MSFNCSSLKSIGNECIEVQKTVFEIAERSTYQKLTKGDVPTMQKLVSLLGKWQYETHCKHKCYYKTHRKLDKNRPHQCVIEYEKELLENNGKIKIHEKKFDELKNELKINISYRTFSRYQKICDTPELLDWAKTGKLTKQILDTYEDGMTIDQCQEKIKQKK